MKKIFNQHLANSVLFKRFALSLVLGIFFAAPAILFAQANPSAGFTTLGGVITTFTNTIVKALGSLFVAAGVVAFFYGMVEFIWAQREGNGEKSKKAKSFMVWGLLGVFVMVSVWGIIIYAQTLFGIQGQTDIVIPQMRISGSAGGVSSAGGAGGGLPTACDGQIVGGICYPNP